ncbi:VCBS repeat-containing protein [Aliiglaciecola sp. CAU 1673]|uniref:FG-GAP repeat domain-containing protein n=1 Tax=Aliiglaciecola sp. CAU 1673 TaxID=3032595 RepID=UPI0023DC10B8|nr:VCBS repeat-containing protein [Aliiglaciecola sp. CAU 1673]MDF2176884.1 VCBS repeat-containing protein [Aliiglaciecola sp. CAU 1673]
MKWLWKGLLGVGGCVLVSCASANMLVSAKPLVWVQENQQSRLLLPEKEQLLILDQTMHGFTPVSSINTRDKGIVAMAMARLGPVSKPVFVAERGILTLKNGIPEVLVAIEHLYQGLADYGLGTSMQHIEFVFELNGDGLSDFILPGFGTLKLALQKPGGQFTIQELALSQHRQLALLRNESPSLTLSLPHGFTPLGADGGFLFAYGGQLWTLTAKANKDGQSWQVEPFPSVLDGPGKHNRFARLADMNGDGLTDLLVQVSAEGENDSKGLHLYLGQRDSLGQFGLAPKPGGAISAEGELVDFDLGDFNGDGKLDLYTLSADLGIGSVLSVLGGSGMDMQIQIYLQGQQGQFTPATSASQSTEFAFDTQNMHFGTRIVAAPFRDVGQADLLYLSDGQTLKLAHGDRKNGLRGKGQKVASSQAKQGDWFVALDADQDGVWELYIKAYEDGRLQRLRQITSQ